MRVEKIVLRSSKRVVLTALFVVATLTTPAIPQTRGSGLPNLGDGEDMSLTAELRLGQRIAREIYRDPDYLDDPVLGDYVQSLWQPLLASARARGELSPEMDERFAWQPILARDRTVNAFALPGGYMGVHLGLIALVSSRDELASVLGHELSHVTQRHIARASTKQAQQAPWVIAAMILGVLAARKNADAANAAITGSQAVAVQGQLNFSREMEREADRIGFSVMTGAGFDGHGFVSMFDKLQHANRINDNGSFPYLRSHPLTTERIADAQLRMAQGGSPSPLVAQAIEPLLMGARAKVLADPGVDNLRAWASEAQAPAALNALPVARQAAALYAGALAMVLLKTPQAAQPMLSRLAALTAQEPEASRVVGLLSAELALAQGDARRALLLLPPATSSVGSSRAALLLTAQALTQSGQAAQASGLLQPLVATHANDALAWQHLAAAHAAQGQQVRAIGADAESRVAQFDYSAAIDRFKAAQSLQRAAGSRSAADNIEASIIDTRLRQVELLFREQALQR